MEEKSPQESPEPDDRRPSGSPPGGPLPRRNNSALMWGTLGLLVLCAYLIFKGGSGKYSEIDYSFFLQQVDAEAGGNVERVTINKETGQIRGRFKEIPPAPPLAASDSKTPGKAAKPPTLKQEFVTWAPLVNESLMERLAAAGVTVDGQEPSDEAAVLLTAWLLVPLLLLLGFWLIMRRTRDQFMGGGMFSSFTKSPAKKYEAGDSRVTFDNVAGLEGVKADLQETVEFLKSPEKFERIGARIPKGMLLMGPPGTGKTLLARAVAGEAGVPFFSMSGSEFIQMFVGVGAGRVRDLFKTAKEQAPSILFIDEIDAVGRQRGAGLGGGHDEREQTLNQILSEMDGFERGDTVIVVAATNRPDVLDPALLRPGRFDRHIMVDRPTQEGRHQILKVHTKNVRLGSDVDLERMSAATIGLTGADIENLVNEAALWATRQDRQAVTMVDFEHALDKLLMGAKREEVLNEKEREMTAYHEAGHALLAWLVPGADVVHKVTIIPRGRALGVTQLQPQEDRLNIGEGDLNARLTFMLGGRAAEKLIFDEYSAGAENDLKECTRLATRMVTRWGMSEKLGPVAYDISDENPFLGKEMAQEHRRHYSERTAEVIDQEVARILHDAEERAAKLLDKNRDKLEKLTRALQEHEILDTDEIRELIGPSVNTRPRLASGSRDQVGDPVNGDREKVAQVKGETSERE